MFQPFLTSGSGHPQHPYMVAQPGVSQQPLFPLPQPYQAQQGLQYTALQYPQGSVPVQVGNPQIPGRAVLGAGHMPPPMPHGYSMHQPSVTSPQKTYQFSWNEARSQAQGQTQATLPQPPTNSAPSHHLTQPLPLPPSHSVHIKPWNIPSNAVSRPVQPTPLSSLANSQQVPYLTGPSCTYSSMWTKSTEKKSLDVMMSASNPLSAPVLPQTTVPPPVLASTRVQAPVLDKTPVLAPSPAPLKSSYQSQNVPLNIKSAYGMTDINTTVTSDAPSKNAWSTAIHEESGSSTVDDDGPPIAPHPFAMLKKNALQVEDTETGIDSKTASQSVDTSIFGTRDQLGSRMTSVKKHFTERVKADRFMEIALKRGIVVTAAEAEPSIRTGALVSNTESGTASQSGDDSDINSIVSWKEDADAHTDSGSVDNTDAKSSTSEGCSRKSDGYLSDFSNEFAKVIIEDACCELNLELNHELNVNAVPFNPVPFSSRLDATAKEFKCRFTAEEASPSALSLNPDSPEFKPSFFRDKAKNKPDPEDPEETDETEASDELDVCRLFKKNHSSGVDVYIADSPTPEAETQKAPCQSDALFVDVAVNTKRIKTKDVDVQTPLAFEPRDVGVNTEEACSDETSEFFTPQMVVKTKSPCVNACVETRCRQVQVKIGPKMKSQGVQVGSTDDLVAKQCDVCPERDIQLIETQMQLCHLKAQICISELQRQLDDLQHSKMQITSFFSPQSGVDSLTDMVDARIVWLQEEIAQTKIHLMNCLKDLQCGHPLSAIPAFSITLPTVMGNEVYTPKELKFLRSPPTDVNTESPRSRKRAHERDKATMDSVCPLKTMPTCGSLERLSPQKTMPGLQNISPCKTIPVDAGNEAVSPQQAMPYELGFERMSPYKSTVHEISERPSPPLTMAFDAGVENMSSFNTVSADEGFDRVPTRQLVEETLLEMQRDRSWKGSESDAPQIRESGSLKDPDSDVAKIYESESLKGQESDSTSIHDSGAEPSAMAVRKCSSVESGSEILNSDSEEATLSLANEGATASSSLELVSGSSQESLSNSVLNPVMISSLSSCEGDRLEQMSSQCSSKSSVTEDATAGTESQHFSELSEGTSTSLTPPEKSADPETGHCAESEELVIDNVTKPEPLPCMDNLMTDNRNVTANPETTRTDAPVTLDDTQQEHEPNQSGENISLPKPLTRISSKGSPLGSLPKPIPTLPLRLPPRRGSEFVGSPDLSSKPDSEYETASSSLSSTPVATDTEERASGDATEMKLDAVKPDSDKRVPPGFENTQNDIEEDINDIVECEMDTNLLMKKAKNVLQNYQLAAEKGRVDVKASISGSPVKPKTLSPHKQQVKCSPDKPRTDVSPNKPMNLLSPPKDLSSTLSSDVSEEEKPFVMSTGRSVAGTGEVSKVVSHLKASAMKRLGVRQAVADEKPSTDYMDVDLPPSGNPHHGRGLPMTKAIQENFNTNHHISASPSSNPCPGFGLPVTETPQENFNTNHHTESSEINQPQVHPQQQLQQQQPPSQQVPQPPVQQAMQPDQLNPNLFQAVLAQVVKAYPQLTSNPVMLQTVCVQQTMVLQSYMKVPGAAPAASAGPGIPGTHPEAHPVAHPDPHPEPHPEAHREAYHEPYHEAHPASENLQSIQMNYASPLGQTTKPLQAPSSSDDISANMAIGSARPTDTAQSSGAAWNPIGLVNMMQARRGKSEAEQAAVPDVKTQNPSMFKFKATTPPEIKACGPSSFQPIISGTATGSETTPPGLRSYILKDKRSTEAAAVVSTHLTGLTPVPTEDTNPFEQHGPPSLTKSTSLRKRSTTTKPRGGGRISPVTHDPTELFPSVKATKIETDEDWEDECEKYPEEFTCKQDVKRPVYFRPINPPKGTDENPGSRNLSRSTTPDTWDQPYRSRHLSQQLLTNSTNPGSRSGSFRGRSRNASEKQASGATTTDFQTKSQSSSRSCTPTEEVGKMSTSSSVSSTQAFRDLGESRKMSCTGLDEIEDFGVKKERKPNKPDANFLGRLLKNNANVNERLKKEKKKNKGGNKPSKPEPEPEPSLVDEDDWQTVGMKKRKRDQTRAEPAASTALVAATSKGASKAPRNNFDKLVEHLARHFPFLSRGEVIELVTSVRSQRGGLTGMKLNDIVDVARGIAQKKMMAKLVPEHGPKVAAAAQKGGNIYSTPEFQKYYETTRKELPHRPAITSPGNSANDEDVCPICFEDFSVAKKQRLDCGHDFHTKCIREWVLGHERTCPTCRRYTLFQEEFPRLK
ncbi:serine-rich adhesin for platelets-like [Haliotis cracherodii]|uniref:serine-rich adhesin for platelets-like n=1 Tax=Haliotis cracherodii TaxID=6455 RepID=UPI0039E98E38